MYLAAVSGKFMEQKIRSDTHSDKTNAVVACDLKRGQQIKAKAVTKLPEID